MFEFIAEHQLNIMLVLCGSCAAIAFLLLITKAISRRRKFILLLMQLNAITLLYFDRLAYIYAGDPSRTGYIMVRLSNFFVFFLTPALVLYFNMYLSDLLRVEGKRDSVSVRLKFVQIASFFAMALAIFAHFTGLYYTFDEMNVYHRGPGFIICYILPVVCPIIQYTVIRQYKKFFSRAIYISLVLYLAVPIAMSIVQIFAYGLSLANMSMVIVSALMYVFTYIDINDTVERIHKTEMESLQAERSSMKRLFDQTALAFVSAAEARDRYAKGHSFRVAEYSRRLARFCGKSEDVCEAAYYTGLLHDVGMVGLPDSIVGKEDTLTAEEHDELKKKPVIGAEILSGITEYPYLSKAARSIKERYDGTGYPDGLKGEEIPELARIVSVAEAYDAMKTKKRTRGALPPAFIREEFIKGAGVQFDPEIAGFMVQMIDADVNEQKDDENEEAIKIEHELTCNDYRSSVTNGIEIGETVTRIQFSCTPAENVKEGFSGPAIIMFDAFDGRTHDNEKAIKVYHYLEYGELWFDGHSINTAARNISVSASEKVHADNDKDGKANYEIVAGKYEDHVEIRMSSPARKVDAVIALPDSTQSVYIGLTGENCHISEISIEQLDRRVKEGDIPRIADEISYIERLESDLPNIQIDRTRSASTPGVAVKDRMRLMFHTMSLPTASLVWHCPYILLFYSDNGLVNGPGYREYAFIKLNGEDDGSDEFAENRFVMKRNNEFPGWEEWKIANKEGLDCEIEFSRRGGRIGLYTKNLGISIENVTTVKDGEENIYAALTGDQCALTDIRIM